MRVWLVEPDGSYIDETEMDKVPGVGETVAIDAGYKAGYRVLDVKQDEHAKQMGAQVLVVEPVASRRGPQGELSVRWRSARVGQPGSRVRHRG